MRKYNVIKQKNIVCIIPARLKSTRFPEKILKNLGGKPLLQWAWDAANKTTIFKDIVFAIDSEKTAKVIKNFSGKYIMTSQNCKSGTDRLIEVMHSGKIDGEIWVNWQADEPFINQKMIYTLLQTCDQNDSDIWSLKKKIINDNEIISPNFAKVVCNSQGHAMYFSRSQIPFYRDKENVEKKYYKHVGIYAYTKTALQKIAKMKTCYFEDAEKLEQLRFLFYGLKIKLHETDQEVIGIDTPEHLKNAEKFINKNK
ncbi:3-deoxy-manno-octulosonate cytidylyltransferase [Candidatus Dependentiae bacterium]|nr:3-deoxy-manno-octulosonate cytidylyltransferase [Candidatus Dependentiae bacterium]